MPMMMPPWAMMPGMAGSGMMGQVGHADEESSEEEHHRRRTRRAPNSPGAASAAPLADDQAGRVNVQPGQVNAGQVNAQPGQVNARPHQVGQVAPAVPLSFVAPVASNRNFPDLDRSITRSCGFVGSMGKLKTAQALEWLVASLDSTMTADLTPAGLLQVLWLLTRIKPSIAISALRILMVVPENILYLMSF